MITQVFADGALIYDPRLEGYELLGLTATVSVSKAGTAEIVMPAGHPAHDSFVCFRTVVEIRRDEKTVFRGRALYPSDDFRNNRTITCEGERCFLRDGVMQPYLYQASPAVIFADVMARYNAQVEPWKRFVVGSITAKDPNGYVRLESESATTVADVVDKLVERVGGYITFSWNTAGERVINWLGSLNKVCSQRIEFGENLIDFSRSGVNTEFATVLYPYGAKDEDTGIRVNISGVNNGRLYVQDDDAVARHGTVAAPVFYDDVTLPSNLMTKARQELNRRKRIVTSLELTAADLAAQGIDVEPLEPGVNVPVYSPPHGLDDTMLLDTRDYDFLYPDQDTVVLGEERVTLTREDVASNRNTLNQLQRAEQSIKTDYEIKISDAINTVRR